MQNFIFDKDITVLYVTASSFPDGVLQAHQKLHSLIPFSTERKYFGVSRPEGEGLIVYRAGAEELQQGEGKKAGCETLVLKKGKYTGMIVRDYMKDIQGIQRAFDEILSVPGIDPQGYCVEWYLSDKDVQCMVRLADYFM